MVYHVYKPTKYLRIDGKTILISEYHIITILIEWRYQLQIEKIRFPRSTVYRFDRHINRYY